MLYDYPFKSGVLAGLFLRCDDVSSFNILSFAKPRGSFSKLGIIFYAMFCACFMGMKDIMKGGDVFMAEARAEGEMQKIQQQGPGKTVVADVVVAKIAGIAAREVQGVHALGGPTERAISGAISRITGAGARAAGVAVQVGEEEAAVDLSLIVDYGRSIPDVTNAVRQNIINQVESMTGLRVKEVNIAVNDLYFPEEEQQPMQPGESESRVA